MPFIIADSAVVCSECARGYDWSETSVEWSSPIGYPDGYTCDDCGIVYTKVYTKEEQK